MGIFDNRVEYKPFEYQEFDKTWFEQSESHWMHTKISMEQDIKDWNENLSLSEKNLVGNILLGFAQTECAVSDYWTNHVCRWFPKHEIKEMCIAFGYFETIHAKAYSYLNESLNLIDFKGFLHEPSISNKLDTLSNTLKNYTYKDLKESEDARIDVASSLAIFSAFTEGVSLFSAFSVLYSFQRRNLLCGIGQQMKWSVRDESLHSKMGCRLFRIMCEEYPTLKIESKQRIIDGAKLNLMLELDYIDKMFEMGDLENLRKVDLIEFIKERTNSKLVELGYEPIISFDKKRASKLDWFYEISSGQEHTDFFKIRPTDYSEISEDENWSDGNIWSFLK